MASRTTMCAAIPIRTVITYYIRVTKIPGLKPPTSEAIRQNMKKGEPAMIHPVILIMAALRP